MIHCDTSRLQHHSVLQIVDGKKKITETKLNLNNNTTDLFITKNVCIQRWTITLVKTISGKWLLLVKDYLALSEVGYGIIVAKFNRNKYLGLKDAKKKQTNKQTKNNKKPNNNLTAGFNKNMFWLNWGVCKRVEGVT